MWTWLLPNKLVGNMKFILPFLFIVLCTFCTQQVIYADEEMDKLKNIMDVSLQYNKELLEILKKIPENPEEDTVSKANDRINVLFESFSQKTMRLTKDIYKKGDDLSHYSDYMDIMGSYRQNALIVCDSIKKELRRINSRIKIEITVIKHEFSNPDCLHEDTRKNVVSLSDEIEDILLEVDIVLQQVQDKKSAEVAFKQLDYLMGRYRFLSNLLYLYCVDDQETGEPLAQVIQKKYLIINKRIEGEIDRLEKHGYYQVVPLMQLLEAAE